MDTLQNGGSVSPLASFSLPKEEAVAHSKVATPTTDDADERSVDGGRRLLEGARAQPMNPGERLYRESLRRKEKMEHWRSSRKHLHDLQIQSSMTSKPEISPLAQARHAAADDDDANPLKHFFERQERWHQEAKERTARIRRAHEVSLRTLQREPQIDSHSKRLMEEAAYVDPVEGWQWRFESFFRSRQPPSRAAMERNRRCFSPNINRHVRTARPPTQSGSRCDATRGCDAARIEAGDGSRDAPAVWNTVDDAPWSERLYRDAETWASRASMRRQQRRRELRIDQATSTLNYTPQFRSEHPRSACDGMESADVRAARAAKRLYHLAVAKQQAKHLDDDDSAPSDPEETFVPRINPHSLQLAQQMTRLPLYQTPSPRPPRVEEKESTAVDADRSGTQARKVSPTSLVRRMEAYEERSKRRHQEAVDQWRKQEEKPCTFHPLISKRSLELFRSTHRPAHSCDDGGGNEDTINAFEPSDGSSSTPLPCPTKNLPWRGAADATEADHLRYLASRKDADAKEANDLVVASFGADHSQELRSTSKGEKRLERVSEKWREPENTKEAEPQTALSHFEQQMVAVLNAWKAIEGDGMT